MSYAIHITSAAERDMIKALDYIDLFYVVSEKQKMVYIVRFLYQKSDWISILRSGFSLS